MALVETQGSRKFRLGKVLKEANDWHTVHLFAAQKASKAIRAKSSRPAGQAKFKLAHVDPSDGMLVFDKRFTKWTMQFDTNEKLVFAINIELNARNGTLTSESLGRIPQNFAPIIS